MIEVKGLRKTYGSTDGPHVVFSGVDCVINDGDVIGIIGPSGGGKSTFINCLMMLDKADSGQILYNGEDVCAPGADVTGMRRKIGVVFQDFNLFPHLTIMENITLAPMKVDGISSKQAEDLALDLLKSVGLADLAGKYPDQLSGGQKQRVAIARCLAMNPEVIFFDEPTSSLDTARKKEVASVIKKLSQERGLTMVIVTHEHKLIQRVCNRVFFFADKTLYEQGTVQEVFGNPQKELTRAFVQNIFGMKYVVRSRDFDLYDLHSQIDTYCMNNSLQSYSQRLELLTEELMTHIMPYSGDITVTLKLGHDGKPAFTVIQDNLREPVLDREGVDEISAMMVRGLCEDIVDEQMGDARCMKFSLK